MGNESFGLRRSPVLELTLCHPEFPHLHILTIGRNNPEFFGDRTPVTNIFQGHHRFNLVWIFRGPKSQTREHRSCRVEQPPCRRNMGHCVQTQLISMASTIARQNVSHFEHSRLHRTEFILQSPSYARTGKRFQVDTERRAHRGPLFGASLYPSY